MSKWPRSGLWRGALAGFSTLGLMALVAGCGSSPASGSGNGKVVDITYWNPNSSGQLKLAIQAEIKKFNQTHPNIHVTWQTTDPNVQGMQAFMAGKAPNAGQVNAFVVPELVSAGALVPLNSYINGPNGLTPSQIHQWFYPVVWSDMMEGAKPPHLFKDQYMMPEDRKTLLIIYYNKKLFQQAGITSAPTTWAQVGQDAAKISALGPRYHGIAWTPENTDSLDEFYDMVIDLGGHVYAPGGENRYDFNNAGARTALSMLTNWVSKGWLVLTSGYEYQLDFATGKVGMIFDNAAGYTYDAGSVGNKFPMGAIQAPQNGIGHPIQYVNGDENVIFNTGTAAQKAAAWTLIKWLASPSTQVYYDEHTDYVPMGPAAYNAMKGFYKTHPNLAASFTDPRYWWYKPRFGTYEASANAVMAIWMKALQGRMPINTALQQMTTVGTNYLSGKTKG